mmetsp:Transcript_29627/g.52880  ORF Transcript_29627/g.52880 Transcript_29627/m.52880 type:complete len:205 (+) Transcript_29627:636-1250(+)
MGNLCYRPDAKTSAEPQVCRETVIGQTTIRVVRGDLAAEKVDVIVNPANSQLRHVGGVSSNIVHSGGLVIQHESNLHVSKFGNVTPGQIVETTPGSLPCTYLFHAVVKPYFDGLTGELESLSSAIRAALEKAKSKKAKCISMPAVGSGILGYPRDLVARVLLEEVQEHCQNLTTLIEVRVTLSDDLAIRCLEAEFDLRFSKPAL